MTTAKSDESLVAADDIQLDKTESARPQRSPIMVFVTRHRLLVMSMVSVLFAIIIIAIATPLLVDRSRAKTATSIPNGPVITPSSTSASTRTISPLSTKTHTPIPATATIAPGVGLRIMPLGASITYGIGSSDGNGYRQNLQDQLGFSAVQYIGSVQSGTMADKYNEGHPGLTIKQVSNYVHLSLPDHPNVILIHVGTNDLINNAQAALAAIPSAPGRMGALVDMLLQGAPKAAILVSALIHTANPDFQERVEAFNEALPAIVEARVAKGYRVLCVGAMGNITGPLNKDGIHPTDAGYKLMADVWFEALQEADRKGWITPPE